MDDMCDEIIASKNKKLAGPTAKKFLGKAKGKKDPLNRRTDVDDTDGDDRTGMLRDDGKALLILLFLHIRLCMKAVCVNVCI